MSSNILSLIGWSFLPNLVTGWTQSIWYGLTIRAGDPKPAPGTPRYIEHRRRIHILVVSVYLLYTIYEADYELQRAGTYYSDLGVPFVASERDIKSRFRRLAAVYHPDKVTDGTDGANYFMHLKTASDTLVNDAKRFAYDRFGTEIVDWQHTTTIRDFVARGVFQNLLPHYAVAAIAMYVFGMLGYLDWGKYWRWLLLLSLCIFEVHIITRPALPPIIAVPNQFLARFTTHQPYIQWQIISLARKICITAYIAFSQIGPLLNPQQQLAQKAAEGGEESLRQGLDRLEAMASGLDTEAGRLLDMEMAPFVGDRAALGNMRHKVKEWLVQNTIRADPMVRDAMGNSFRKRRVDAPAGARGNR